MSFQWILHPSNDDPGPKSVLAVPQTHPGASLRVVRSTPFVRISSSSEPRDPATSFTTSPLPSTDLPTTSNSSTGITVSRPISNSMRASIGKDKPSGSNSTPPFPLTPYPLITNLHGPEVWLLITQGLFLFPSVLPFLVIRYGCQLFIITQCIPPRHHHVPTFFFLHYNHIHSHSSF